MIRRAGLRAITGGCLFFGAGCAPVDDAGDPGPDTDTAPPEVEPDPPRAVLVAATVWFGWDADTASVVQVKAESGVWPPILGLQLASQYAPDPPREEDYCLAQYVVDVGVEPGDPPEGARLVVGGTVTHTQPYLDNCAGWDLSLLEDVPIGDPWRFALYEEFDPELDLPQEIREQAIGASVEGPAFLGVHTGFGLAYALDDAFQVQLEGGSRVRLLRDEMLAGEALPSAWYGVGMHLPAPLLE